VDDERLRVGGLIQRADPFQRQRDLTAAMFERDKQSSARRRPDDAVNRESVTALEALDPCDERPIVHVVVGRRSARREITDCQEPPMELGDGGRSIARSHDDRRY
jgi:hypothetical protein